MGDRPVLGVAFLVSVGLAIMGCRDGQTTVVGTLSQERYPSKAAAIVTTSEGKRIPIYPDTGNKELYAQVTRYKGQRVRVQGRMEYHEPIPVNQIAGWWLRANTIEPVAEIDKRE